MNLRRIQTAGIRLQQLSTSQPQKKRIIEMTDQSPNDQFHASSFMQGHNAEYLKQMYARYAGDPNAVDAAWQAFSQAA